MPNRRTKAFTLVELLVVIAIIGILVALLLPAVQAAREAARRMQCSNNTKQLSLAVHTYHDTHTQFPPGSIRWTAPRTGNSWETQHTHWVARILPYIEQPAIYSQINFSDTRPFESAPAKPGYLLRKVEISTVRCPSNPGNPYGDSAGPCNYVGCAGASDGVDGGYFSVAGPIFFRGIMLENSGHSFASVRDGTANTMLIGECLIREPYICRSQCGTNVWPQPACYTGTDGLTLTTDDEEGRGISWFNGYGGENWGFNTLLPPNDKFTKNHECMTGSTRGAYTARSRHPGGVNIGMADGSVTFVSETIDLWVWGAVSTMDGSTDPRQPVKGLE